SSQPTPATAPPPAVTTVRAATPTQQAPVPATAPTSAAAIATALAILPPLMVSTAACLVPLPPVQLFCPRVMVSVFMAGLVAWIVYVSPDFVDFIVPASNHLTWSTYPPWLYTHCA